jgi:hypothetical protein
MSTCTYAILNEEGICIDRIVVDDDFNPKEYHNYLLDEMGVIYTLEKENEGEELFLDVEVAPHIVVQQTHVAGSDILSQLSDDQKQQLIALLTQQNTENPPS